MAGLGYNWPQHFDPIWLVSWWAGVPERDSGVTLLSRSVSDYSSLGIIDLVVIHSCNLLIDWASQWDSWLLITKNTKHECFHQSEVTQGQFSRMLVSLKVLEGCDMQTPTAPLWPVSGQLGTLWWPRRLISWASHSCCSPHSWVDWHWLCGIGIIQSVVQKRMSVGANIQGRWINVETYPDINHIRHIINVNILYRTTNFATKIRCHHKIIHDFNIANLYRMQMIN